MAKQDIVKVPFSKERFDLICLYHGVTQKAVAEASGVTKNVISKAKKSGVINEEYLPKLGLVLQVTPSFLTGDKAWDKVADAYKTIAEYIDVVLDEYGCTITQDITIE